MTIRKNPGALFLFVIFGLIFWPLVVYDRLFLGKHTINQVLLGSLIGFWLASFMHFYIRDMLFNHITNISSSAHRINGQQVAKYFSIVAAFFIILFAIMSIYMYILAAKVTMEQSWLVNLHETCEYEFEVDSEGNFVPDMHFFFIQHISVYTFYFSILGFYLGQLYLSYKGRDIPEPYACDSCSDFFRRALISILTLILAAIPLLVEGKLEDKFPLWIVLICFSAIPQFVFCFVVMYWLTVLLDRCSGQEN